MDDDDEARAEAISGLLFGADGSACVRALLTQVNAATLMAFGEVQAVGAGVYLLYHVGEHALYDGLTKDCPVYIGKAVGEGSGVRSQLDVRLRDHQKSLALAEDLRADDFRYKVLRINDEWVAGCESVLIKHWQPLWNTVVTGFGNHAPGRGRQNQRRSLWDTLHAGRPWAQAMDPEVPYTFVADLVRDWCRARGYPARARAPCAEGSITEQFVT